MQKRLPPLFLILMLAWTSSATEYIQRFAPGDKTQVRGVVTDGAGNLYVCGDTANAKALGVHVRLGPSSAGAGISDGFLLKIAPGGRRLGAVVFGGGGFDFPLSIGVDAEQNVVVAGYTTSMDFPTRRAWQAVSGGYAEGFVAKFDSSGTNLLFSTYLGGRSNDAVDKLAIDANGGILLGGSTSSGDFANGTNSTRTSLDGLLSRQDVFLVKLAGDGSRLEFKTRLEGFGFSELLGMALDPSGNILLTGSTTAFDFSTFNAFQPIKPLASYESAFLTKVAPDGTLVFSTFLGGDCRDRASAVAANEAGEIFVAGSSCSKTFPALTAGLDAPALPDPNNAFLAKFDPFGRTLLNTNVLTLAPGGRLVSVRCASNGNVTAAGVVSSHYGALGIPMLLTVRADGSVTRFVDSLDCPILAGVDGMAMNRAGDVFIFGQELSAASPNLGSYVAKYSAIEEPAGPRIKLLHPIMGEKVSPRDPLSARVAVVGAAGAVESVSYYEGARLIGVATNAPFAIVWTNLAQGPHRLRAVARISGALVTSCDVRFTARSPQNDNFANRIFLSGARVVVAGDTSAATREGIETGPYKTVWYSWTASRDGVVEFRLEGGQSVSGSVTVYTGSSLENLVTVSPLSSTPRTLVRARQGTVYHIQVGIPVDSPFRLTIRRVIAPANDDFVHAQALRGESVSVKTSVRNATLQRHEADAYSGLGTTWFSWTAPSAGPFLASIEGSGEWFEVEVGTATTVSNFTSMGQRISGMINGAAWLAQNGVRYFIRLRSLEANELTLKISRWAPPPNDNFADRLPIPAGATVVTGTLVAATSELGEQGSLVTPARATVWWTWSPPTAGVYRVALIPLTRPPTSVGLFYPAIPNTETVSIYVGDALAGLIPLSSERGSSLVHASPETNYHFQVSGGAASFALVIQPVPIPVNDDFDSASPLFGAVTAAIGSTTGATLEPGEPFHIFSSFYGPYDDSVWYRWTAPSNGVYALSAELAADLAVYAGDSLAGLTALAANATRHTVRLDGGVEYRIAVVSGEKFNLVIRPALRPTNDDFANRAILSGLLAGAESSIGDASAEPEEPAHAGSAAHRSIWFSWTAPANGSFLVHSTNYDSSRIAIYTGETLSGLAPFVASADYRGLELKASAGVTYQIAVEPNLYATSIGLEIRYQSPPANDAFANRIQLTGDLISIVASNVGATFEENEPPNTYSAAGNSVWWTWRAPKDGRVTFFVERVGYDSFNPSVRVSSGRSLRDLSAPWRFGSLDNAINLAVRAGEEFQISVDNNAGDPAGYFRLGLRYTPIPKNDRFADRLTFSGRVAGTMEGASRERDETWYQFLDGSVWWKWTPSAGGDYELSLSTDNLPMGIVVYTGDVLKTLLPVDESPNYPPTTIRVRVTAGTRYIIELLGDSAGGPYTLQAKLLPRPGNDDFVNRIALYGSNLSVIGSNSTATGEADEPPHGGQGVGKSVWWSWTAPAGGVVRITRAGFPFNPIAVYTGDALPLLSRVVAGETTVVFEAVGGTKYQIAMDSAESHGMGSGDVRWSLRLYSSPSNDAFTNRLALSGVAVTTPVQALGATVEPGEPLVPFSFGHSLWWKWIAPETGRYTFAISNATSSVLLTLFAGTELTNLAVLASNVFTRPILNIAVAAGAEIVISADPDFDARWENLELTIRQVASPPNDNFASRAILNDGDALGNLEGSSRETGEPDFEEGPGGTSVWWSFTPTNDGWHSFNVITDPAPGLPPRVPSFQAGAVVYRGSALTNLQRVAWQIPLDGLLTAGVNYSIRVSGIRGWFGPVRLSATYRIPPSNDRFANAVEIIAEGSTLTASNHYATVEPGEPARFVQQQNSIWWRWTAATNGVYLLRQTGMTIDVYTGSSVSNLLAVPDAFFGHDYGGYLFRAEAGTTYYISAVSRLGWASMVNFGLSRAHPPPNDDFAQRAALPGAHISLIASNHDATVEPGEPASVRGEQTVWWRWIATVSGLTTVDVQSTGSVSSAHFQTSVFRGDALTNLIAVAAGFPRQTQFEAEAGIEYAIAVTTVSYKPTFFTLTLDVPEERLLQGPVSGPKIALRAPFPPTSPTWVVETSKDLVNWIPFTTNASGRTEFPIVPDLRETQRFYRVR